MGYFNNSFEVRGRNVVISGGSQGLGAALAEELVLLGANVIIVARTKSKLNKTVDELAEKKVDANQKVSAIAADCSDPGDCKRVFSEVDPDVVICCAGVAVTGLFADLTSEQLEYNITIGYKTAVHFAHAAVKKMTSKANPQYARHIVLCSSVAALFPFIGYSAYAPTKAAVRALGDILYHECLPYNIKVANVMPGNMETEGFEVEERTKPEITKIIEGSSFPKDPGVVARGIIKDLEWGRSMITTDFIGWVLQGLCLGLSERTYGPLQMIMAIIVTLVAPIYRLILLHDIRSYYRKKSHGEHAGGKASDAQDSVIESTADSVTEFNTEDSSK